MGSIFNHGLEAGLSPRGRLHSWAQSMASSQVCRHSHPLLVAIGSATAVMLIGDFVQDDTQAISRVLQGLITGLGFLGAGVILHEQQSSKIHGLTTAASLWACALVGAAFGAGKFMLASLSIGAIFLALALGGPMEKLISRLTGIRRGSEISEDTE